MVPKIALSITSFLPLYSLMVTLYLYTYQYQVICANTKKYIIITIIAIVLVQIISTLIVNWYIKNKTSSRVAENEVVFTDMKEDKKVYVDYMMTYLLPLLTTDIQNVDGFYIVYTNVLILIFILMNARAENFNFNILLWIKGYSVYKGMNIDGCEKTLLLKKRKFSNIKANHTRYKFVSFGASNDIYICKRYNESGK